MASFKFIYFFIWLKFLQLACFRDAFEITYPGKQIVSLALDYMIVNYTHNIISVLSEAFKVIFYLK